MEAYPDNIHNAGKLSGVCIQTSAKYPGRRFIGYNGLV